MLPGIALTLDRARAAARHGPRRARCARRSSSRSTSSSRATAGARRCSCSLFIFLYKLGDSMATALATPFYLDMGFTKTDIGVIAKNAGLWASVDRRAARRPVDGEDRHQSRPVAVRRRAARVDPRLRVARLRAISRTGCCWRSSSPSRRSASASAPRRSPRTSRARPTRATRRRSSRCSRASPPCRARWSTRRPAGSSSAPAGSTSTCCARCWRCPAWLLLLAGRAVERRSAESAPMTPTRPTDEPPEIQRDRAPRPRLLQPDLGRQDRAAARPAAARRDRRACSTSAAAAPSSRCGSSSASARA